MNTVTQAEIRAIEIAVSPEVADPSKKLIPVQLSMPYGNASAELGFINLDEGYPNHAAARSSY